MVCVGASVMDGVVCSVNGWFEIFTRGNGAIVGGNVEYARARVIKDYK
jgi:hypothetical protein